MKIAVLSPVWFPVPPTRYGGIEWIVSLLAEGLVRAGHEVTLFASGDSSTQAELVSVYDEAPSEKIGNTQVELRHARQQQDGAEPQQNPDPDKAYRRERPVEVPKPGTRDHAESDGPEDLVDQARQGQQPAPDDPGRNERDDLGQEQNGPGYRSEPTGRHAVDHARDDETEAHRYEAEPHDKPERVEDRPDQVGNLEDSHVVLQSDPCHRTDAVPLVERVPNCEHEGLKHEQRIHY